MSKAASPPKLMNNHRGLSDSRVLVSRRVGVFDPEPGHVERRYEDKGQHRRDRVVASAWGATSRTRPVARTVGSLVRAICTGGSRGPVRMSCTSKTASRPP